MKSIAKRLTYGNVVATLALFLVLAGGSAIAAGLAKNSVGSKQLKRNAVTTVKIKNDAVTGAKVKESTLGPVPTANALGGQPASAFAIRSAAFLGNGQIVPGQSDGIAQGNVSVPTPGLVCISGLNPAPKTAVVSLNFEATFKTEIFAQVSPSEGGCAGKQIAIATEKEGGGFSPEPFSVIVH